MPDHVIDHLDIDLEVGMGMVAGGWWSIWLWVFSVDTAGRDLTREAFPKDGLVKVMEASQKYQGVGRIDQGFCIVYSNASCKFPNITNSKEIAGNLKYCQSVRAITSRLPRIKDMHLLHISRTLFPLSVHFLSFSASSDVCFCMLLI